jgi:hypothetical protein
MTQCVKGTSHEVPQSNTRHPSATGRVDGSAARGGCRFAGDFTRVLVAIIVGLATSLVAALAVTLAPLLALLGFVVPAHADVSWIATCPEQVNIPNGFQHSGVGNDHTTCSFAENVRLGFAAHPGWTVVAPSPVTGEFYTMDCRRVPGTLPNGVPVENVRCQGGNDAVVGLW